MEGVVSKALESSSSSFLKWERTVRKQEQEQEKEQEQEQEQEPQAVIAVIDVKVFSFLP